MDILFHVHLLLQAQSKLPDKSKLTTVDIFSIIGVIATVGATYIAYLAYKKSRKDDGKTQPVVVHNDNKNTIDNKNVNENKQEINITINGNKVEVNNDKKEVQPENNGLKIIPFQPPRADFFGRESDLKAVRDAISPDSKQWGILIDAFGGKGKTALAVEAAYRAMDDNMFKAYLFVTAKQSELSEEGIIAEDADAIAVDDFINETARKLGSQGIAQMDRKGKKNALFELLSGLPTLLVYDNLETLKEGQAAIVNFLDGLPTGCKAILTSRQGGAGKGRHLKLGDIEWQAAQQIIEKELTKDNGLAVKLEKHRDSWKQLYEVTYGSPLALTHILGLLRVRTALNFEGAIQLLKGKTDSNELIKYMFAEAWKEMSNNDKATLYALSFFEPSADIVALAAVTELTELELNDAIDHLGKLCLVDNTADSRFALHALTREFAKRKLNEAPQLAYHIGMQFARYWLGYGEQYGGSENDSYKTYPLLEQEWDNINTAAEWLWKEAGPQGNKVTDKPAANLLNDMADALLQYLLYAGRWDERIRISERRYDLMALLNDEYNAGWGAYDVAFIALNRGDTALADIWADKAASAWIEGGGRYEKAVGVRLQGLIAERKEDVLQAAAYYQQALATYRQLDLPENEALVLNDLANIFREQKQYAEAEQFYHEAIEKKPDYGDKAMYISNLGLLELDKPNWQEARKWLEQALPMAQETNRQEIIADCHYGLAQVEEGEGNFATALMYAEQALDIRERLRDRRWRGTKDYVTQLQEKLAAQK